MRLSEFNPRTFMYGTPQQLHRYVLGLVVVFALILFGFQFLVPVAMPALNGGQADFVIKLLHDRRPNLVLGDSHVGQRDRLGKDHLFLGRPGATTFELLQAAKVYFSDKEPGRVILEAGPQLFASGRQMEWRTFTDESFRYQAGPVALYALEPELIKAAPSILGLGDLGGYRYGLLSTPKKLPKAVARARAWGKRLAKVRNRLATLEDIPIGARRILATYRYGMQLPVKDYQNSLAWRHFSELLDLLAARGAEVCLLRMPISPELQEIIELAPTGSRYSDLLEGVRWAADNRGMRYLDFKEIFPDLPALYFKNQDHLNDLGHEVFWPAAESACFRDEDKKAVVAVPSRFHMLALKNPGFEAAIPKLGNGGRGCPKGWLWRSPLPVSHLRRFRDTVEKSAFRSRNAYGVWKPEEAVVDVSHRRWWSLGKLFRSQGGAQLEVKLKVRSDHLSLHPKGRDGVGNKVLLSDDDAYIEVAAFDRNGVAIPLPPKIRYSAPLSQQAFDPSRRQLYPPPWYGLSHSFTLPEGTREFKVWLVAVSGGGKARNLGWKGGVPRVLFDDFEILSDGPIKELGLGKRAGDAAEDGRPGRKTCGPKVKRAGERPGDLAAG